LIHIETFCEAEMGLQKFNTHIIESLNPKWNTSMQFQIYDLNKDVLNVVVYDSKAFSPNVFLGKTELRIIQIYREQLKETNNENGPIPITKVFRMSNIPSGKIMLKMSISIFNK
jgi:Ca2+-dependent lipid-binding protein